MVAPPAQAEMALVGKGAARFRTPTSGGMTGGFRIALSSPVASLPDPRCPASSMVELASSTESLPDLVLDCAKWRGTRTGYVYHAGRSSDVTGVRRIVWRKNRLRIVTRDVPQPAGPGTWLQARLTVDEDSHCGRLHELSWTDGGHLRARGPTGDCGPIWFTDQTRAAGLDYTETPPTLPDCNGFPKPFVCWAGIFRGGAAVGDVDGDGRDDLFVARLYDPPLLFRNRGDGTFEDVTVAAGLALPIHPIAAAFGDIDNDGDQDLFVTTVFSTRHYLFVNDGSGVFSEQAIVRGVAADDGNPHWGMSVAFGDYDRDGWLDVYASDWAFSLATGPGRGTSHSRLFRNLGAAQPGFFEDTTSTAGVLLEAFGRVQPFSPTFVDLDADGWQDLTIVSDAGQTRLFWNDGDATFTDGTVAAGVALTGSEMGSTFADFDLDGDLDWFVSAISCVPPYGPGPTCGGNNFYRYDGARSFSQANDDAGVRTGHWGWGAVFFDADNDGDPDLAHVNGQSMPFESFEGLDGVENYHHDPMIFFENDGSGQMTEKAAAVGLLDRGEGKGLLTFDYDDDGDLDLVLTNTGAGVKLYRNDGGNAAGWLRVRTVGTVSNRDGRGARVSVQATESAPTQIREIGVGSHFLGQSERIAHFGLGPGTDPVHSVRVDWPASGASQEWSNVPRNDTLTATEPAGGGS